MMLSHHSSAGRTVFLLVLCTTVLGTRHALAFNGPGHMLIADIAFAQLLAGVTAGSAVAKRTIKAIREIMKAGGRNGFEPAGNSEEDLRNAFAYAATFPDVIKTDRSTDYEPMVFPMNNAFWKTGHPPAGSDKEGQRCRSWHYFDTPLNVKLGAKPKNWESNLKKAWAEATGYLKAGGNPTNEQFDIDMLKFWWLAWLLHMAGDAHQPLHCAENYNGTAKGDAGGNGFKLQDADHSLHTFWDAILQSAASKDNMPISGLVHSNKSYTDILAPVSEAWSKTNKPSAADATLIDINQWVAKGAENAVNLAYDGVEEGKAPDAAYTKRALKFAHNTAVLGGFRLANHLQSLLG